MTIRFFILSAHYRGTVDFSNEALQASEKGLERLLNGIADLQRIQPAKASDEATATIVNELPRLPNAHGVKSSLRGMPTYQHPYRP